MERTLTDEIAEENNFTIISKLDDCTKQYLKTHIQNTILEKYRYPHIEYLEEMINIAIEWFEDDLYAINYISDINYSINDKYYKKLQEEYFDSNDDSICDWEDEFEKEKENIRLNNYSLADFIELTYVDSMDWFVKEFYEADYWKKHPFLDNYQEAIKESLQLYYKFENIERKTKKYKNKDEAISNILNREPFDYENIKLKKNPKPLTKRKTTLITARTILAMNKSMSIICKENIAKNYNINKNTPQTNQELLNNSYDVIIDNIKKFPNTNEIIILLEGEKSNNDNLFTNSKKLSKLKNNNHYMSFLYKCNSVYTDNHLIVFQEFVEALISGYMQYLEFENKEQKIKKHTQDLEVLKRYNSANENDKNIKELEDKISFLSIPKPHEKFIPFKELSNRLEIDINRISNYITNISNNGTHPNTIKQHFGSLKTISKEICISRF